MNRPREPDYPWFCSANGVDPGDVPATIDPEPRAEVSKTAEWPRFNFSTAETTDKVCSFSPKWAFPIALFSSTLPGGGGMGEPLRLDG